MGVRSIKLCPEFSAFHIMSTLGVFYLCYPSACDNSVAQSVVVTDQRWDLCLCWVSSGPWWRSTLRPFLMSPSWNRLWPTIPMWTSVKWGDITLVVMKVFSVSLTWAHVVLVVMVLIVETGISLMELDCLSLHLMLILLRFVYLDLRRSHYVNSPTGIYRCDIPTDAADDDDTSVRGTVYVGLR